VCLSGKDREIPGTEYFALTLQMIAASPFALPSLMQKFGAQFSDRSRIFQFNVAEDAEPFANRARDAEFPGRQHAKFPFARKL
jgi:hypothetical protein